MALIWCRIVALGWGLCLFLPPLVWEVESETEIIVYEFYPYLLLGGVAATGFVAWRVHLYREPWARVLKGKVDRLCTSLDDLAWKVNSAKVSVDLATAQIEERRIKRAQKR